MPIFFGIALMGHALNFRIFKWPILPLADKDHKKVSNLTQRL